MGEVVDLRRPIPIEDDEFIENLARFADGTLTEAAVKAKYRLTEEEWAALGTDDTLVRKIEDVKIHRIRSGRTKRERAQNEIIDAPPILAGIMRNPTANERHKIDSIKALDALATGGAPEAAAAGARFEIRINIGDDSLYFNKSIAINAGDTDPNDEVDTDVTSTPWGLVAAIAKKQGDDGNGNIFDRLREKQPQLEKERQVETIPRGPLLQPVVPPTDSKAPLIEQTLDWIINRWPQPAIRVRDILRFGPAAARNRKSAVALAENLAAHGWLQPLATRQHNMKMWQVVRGPSAPHGS